MSTLLTPIITQLEIDRDRFKILINGSETDTVMLENREENSIAGQVAGRIDSLAVNLNTAVSDAETAETNAINAKDAAVSAKNTAESAENSASNSESNALSHANDAEGYRDQALSYKNDAESIMSRPYYFDRYLTKSAITTGTIDVTGNTVSRVDGTVNTTLTLSESTLANNRSQTVVVFVEDSGGSITWPTEVSWAGGNEPTLGTSWTNILLFWTGTMWIGMESAKK